MSRLVIWTLNLAYLAVLVVGAPLIFLAALRTGKYRAGYAEKLLGRVPRRTGQRPCVWLHAVSVGEVNLLATTIAGLRAQRPDCEIVVSTTTKTGYELAQRKYGDLAVFYCPLDFSWAVRQAMRRVRPSLLVLAELELWPNLVIAAKDYGARVAIINGRLSDNSFRGYRRIRPLVARLLAKLDLVAAQHEETAARFRQLGARSVQVTGSLKFDGAETDCGNARTQALRALAGIQEEDVVLLAGSTQAPEEEMALDVYRRVAAEHPELRLILVPRHPERFDEVAQLLSSTRLAWSRRSELATGEAAHRVLLVDTIGELGSWWGTADIALVGGSFGSRGGQNMIEPAAYGAAVCFGPNTWNFRDIVAQLLAARAAVVVNNTAELETFVRRALDNPQLAGELGRRAQSLVTSQLGATSQTVDLLTTLLGNVPHRPQSIRAA